jgi:hypothetical protein
MDMDREKALSLIQTLKVVAKLTSTTFLAPSQPARSNSKSEYRNPKQTAAK